MNIFWFFVRKFPSRSAFRGLAAEKIFVNKMPNVAESTRREEGVEVIEDNFSLPLLRSKPETVPQ
jgi:hypothetical protein